MTPNVLLIVTDNQSPDSLGCYGNDEHDTPHIDQLARDGMRFLNAFCTNGLCSPARASLLTGLMPSQHGVHLAMPDDDVVPKPPDYDTTREFESIPAMLQRNGYQTAMVGKWHLGNNAHPGHGFDRWVALSKGHTTDFYDNVVYDEGTTERVTGTHIVDHFTNRAVEILGALTSGEDRPWFVQVNYDGPYVLPPTVVGPDARNPHYERFEHASFRPFPPVDERLIRSLAMPFDFDLDPAEEYTLASAFNNIWWAVRSHNDQATRANIAAQNALVDAAVGRLIEFVDSNARNDTLVVFTTDQSNPYGQRGLWGHPVWTDPPFMHDVTFRVPLLVRWPGTVPANRTTDSLVSHYDILPTVAQMIGVDHGAANSPGLDLTSLLTGHAAAAAHDAVFFENETARSIRTHEWLFTQFFADTGTPELFDLVHDPGQWHDVSDRRPEVCQALAAQSDAFWQHHSDPRYDLWNGGTAQAMVAKYLVFKEQYGAEWEPTLEVGSAFVPE